ncbi:anaerobic sulfatase maturase [Pengzhenrongella phosphoraccumulans]|uniref:anaerobic sulfatase maturase n=1 Tax=Pengzhenrongella phosphoraccumulans TaxID=3114394 RepID=UPI00388D5E7D
MIPEPKNARQLAFSVVAKPNGAACNLDCSYCFFLSKELLYDDARQRMSEEVLRDYVRTFLSNQPDGEVTLAWQGGEPTMRGLEFFELAVRLGHEYARAEQQVVHTIQTNGILIDDRWATFLAHEKFLVGLSLDGPAQMHDTFRTNRAGRGTHDQVVAAWRILQRHDVSTNFLCTVNAANQDHGAEVYRYFTDELGATFLQFIPIVERATITELPTLEQGWRTASEHLLYRQQGDLVTSRSVDPEQWGKFMIEVYDEWIARDVGRVYIQHVDGALSAMFGRYPTCVHSPDCGNALAVEYNGDVYSCDHWVEPDWLLGNLAEHDFAELTQTPRHLDFNLKKASELTDQCVRCPVRNFCHGGCPKDRFATSRDGQPGQNYLCAGYEAFFGHMRPDLVAMARLVRKGRAPAEIMRPEVRAAHRPGESEVGQQAGPHHLARSIQ